MGGGLDFVRVYSERNYGIPPEKVMGIAAVTKYGYAKDGKPVLTKVGTFTQKLYAEAVKNGGAVISMKNDWKRIFAFEQACRSPERLMAVMPRAIPCQPVAAAAVTTELTGFQFNTVFN